MIFFKPNLSVEKEELSKVFEDTLEIALVMLSINTSITSFALKRANHQSITTCLIL